MSLGRLVVGGVVTSRPLAACVVSGQRHCMCVCVRVKKSEKERKQARDRERERHTHTRRDGET